ncbi:hypothetical protein ACFLWS_05085 [Chloroflexota bacterium]
MSRLIKMLTMALALVTMPLVSVTGTVFAADGTIDVEVSPHVLNIESNGGSISIHTDIGYVAPEDTTVKVNGEEIERISTILDNRGNLVVKCDIDEVKGIVIPDELAVFVLTCNYNDGVYTGSDSVPVICVIPQKP